MNRLIKYTFFILALLSFEACKKKEEAVDPPSGPSIIEQIETKVRHQWDFDYTVLNIYGANPDSDTIYGQPGDYYLFDPSNLVYSFWNGLGDTVSYKVLGANTMMYGGDTMTINSLQTNEFIFTKTTQTDTTHYDNVIYLSK